MAISIYLLLSHSEKRIYFEKHMFCEICKIVYRKIDFGLLQEGRLLAISIYLLLGLSEKRILKKDMYEETIWQLRTP